MGYLDYKPYGLRKIARGYINHLLKKNLFPMRQRRLKSGRIKIETMTLGKLSGYELYGILMKHLKDESKLKSAKYKRRPGRKGKAISKLRIKLDDELKAEDKIAKKKVHNKMYYKKHKKKIMVKRKSKKSKIKIKKNIKLLKGGKMI